jgi:hypothetical protein
MTLVRSEPSTAVRPAVLVGRIALALIVGALCGAGLVAGAMLVIGAFTGGGAAALMYVVLAFVFALPIWFGSLVVVGLPAWAALRAFGIDPRRVAARAGAVLAGGAAMLWTGALSALTRFSAHELLTVVPFLVAVTLIGAVVGRVVARVAYGRQGQAR